MFKYMSDKDKLLTDLYYNYCLNRNDNLICYQVLMIVSLFKLYFFNYTFMSKVALEVIDLN